MDILNLARQSGMTVVLDARIGQQEYHSVHSSVAALERFAALIEALRKAESEKRI
jgi:imidazoleglycerol phosphate dehydratase HisB